MPCVTSCSELRRPPAWFSTALFLQNWTRFWPVWTLYTAVWLLVLPIGLLNGSAGNWSVLSGGYDPNAYIVQVLCVGIPLSPLFGVLAAMAVFSYLFHPRAAGLMHVLPIRREGLFLTNYLSGLSFFFLPILVVAAIALAVQLYIGPPVAWTALFLWAWCQGLMVLFFFSLACLCVMLTGLLPALPIFFAAANLLVLGLYSLFQQVASCFLFGYKSPDMSWLTWLFFLFMGYGGTMSVPGWVEWLSPLLCYYNHLGHTGPPDYRLTGLLPIFVYGFLGLALAGLALLLYRRRRIEAAGDVVAVPWLRPVFRYGVALCTAVALGIVLWNLIVPTRQHPEILVVLLLLSGALGYFVAEMFLSKSFRVLRRWKGCLVFLLLLLLGTAALALDWTGYESRVPQGGQVVSVSVETSLFAPYDSGGFLAPLTDPEDIAQVVALHQEVVDRREELRGGQRNYEWETWSTDGAQISVETQSSISLNLEYTLADGNTLRRAYTLPVTEELLAQADSPAGRLDALLNQTDQIRRAYFQNWRERDTLVGAYLSSYSGEGSSFAGRELEILYQAVLDDLEAGRLGRHYLLEDADYFQHCYYNDLTFTFYPAQAGSGASSGEASSYTVVFTLQSTAVKTLRVLNELGVEEELLTMAQVSV